MQFERIFFDNFCEMKKIIACMNSDVKASSVDLPEAGSTRIKVSLLIEDDQDDGYKFSFGVSPIRDYDGREIFAYLSMCPTAKEDWAGNSLIGLDLDCMMKVLASNLKDQELAVAVARMSFIAKERAKPDPEVLPSFAQKLRGFLGARNGNEVLLLNVAVELDQLSSDDRALVSEASLSSPLVRSIGQLMEMYASGGSQECPRVIPQTLAIFVREYGVGSRLSVIDE